MRLRWFPSPDYDWRDLLVWFNTLDEGSATYRVQVGEDAFWTPERQFAASQIDLLNILAWQQTRDGHKGRNKPRPIPRPGVTEDTITVKQHGSKKTARTASRIAELLGM